MTRVVVNLLDFPDEILLHIFTKLSNVDILYSFYGINNKRLQRLVKDERFSAQLDFSSTIDQMRIFRRFSHSILPEIHLTIKSLVIKFEHLEHFLVGTDYPNLSQLKLCNFQRDSYLRYLTDNCSFGQILKKQIKRLDLVNEDYGREIGSGIQYTKRVYISLLNFFENIEYFNVITNNRGYTPLSIHCLPSDSFSSSNLTYLRLNVSCFVDCLCILDGRLNQLKTFIVEICLMEINSTTRYETNKLPNLKHFSFTYSTLIKNRSYNEIESLIERMINLQKLTLYLQFASHGGFFNPIDLVNQFSTYSNQLESFSFYLSTRNNHEDLVRYLTKNETKQTFLNIKYEQISNIFYTSLSPSTYHVFTLPFEFSLLTSIGNQFPKMRFDSVIDLWITDDVPLEHEFFLRIAKYFPKLKYFSVTTLGSNLSNKKKLFDHICRDEPVVEYPHLISLDLTRTDVDLVDQFLNENKTRLPRLSHLSVRYEDLRITTQDFTREATRLNCINVTKLTTWRQIVGSQQFHLYFPSL